ncbi:MAG: hypothetical protein ACRC3H_07275 [Lachnospiraceae bacterium]
MFQLNKLTKEWRNYLYANRAGSCNDPEDFMARVDLISDSHEQILENILSGNKSEDIEKASLEEIDFQLENLNDLVDEFIEYYSANATNNALDLDNLKNDIIKELREKGTTGSMYIVANEWCKFKTDSQLMERFQNQVELYDEVCKCVMDTFISHSI